MMHDSDYPSQNTGTSLIPVEKSQPPAVADHWQGPPPTPEILASGVDPMWLLHSLRRRWMLAVGVGLLVGMAAALGVWALIPAKASATALLKVSSVKPHILKPINEGESDFETYRRTLASLMTARPVLDSALNKEGVSTLRSLREEPEENKVNWLRSRLQIAFANNAEVMSVSIDGEHPRDLVLLVDAVVEAFLREVIYKERDQRLKNRDLLKKSYERTMQEIEAKTATYYKLARDLYAFESPQGGGNKSLAFKEVRSIASTELHLLREEVERLERDLFRAKLNIKLLRARRDDPELVSAEVEQLIQEDPQVALLQQQLTAVEFMLSEEAARARHSDAPSVVRYARQRQLISQRLTAREAALRPQLQFQVENTPDAEFTSSLKEAELRRDEISARLAETREQYAAKTEELKRLGERSLELDTRKEELDQLKRVAREMGAKIEALDIEINLPDRVTPIQNAELKSGLNRFQRYVLIGFGGLMGFGLTCFGVSLFEFQARRLNDQEQVDQGLGIPVIGELPPLAGSGKLDAADPRVAMLLEAADSVRTTLEHMNGPEPPRVVMITTAEGSEGGTTVASQLAASLARAGHDTVLIDGDLRHPSLHRLFDLPLERGVCELICGQSELADTVHETGVDRLRLLTAGLFDERSIEAMGRDRIRPLIDLLRERFDYVIIDAAPVLTMTDPLILGRHADGAVLSVRRDVSRVPQIHDAAGRLRRVGVRLLGAVVNGVTRPVHERALRLGFAPKNEETAEAES